ncbi:MAG TPA: hypothetical protein PLG59_20455 [bacterium]|nr:hypothetical protein [bacterium]
MMDAPVQQVRLSKRRNGFAVMVVVPILLFVVLIALFLLYIVQSRLESTTVVLESRRAKYLAHSAVQLALLEIQERTDLRDNAAKGQPTVRVSDAGVLPSQGAVLFGEHVPGVTFGYTRDGDSLRLDAPISQNLPAGTSVYLCRDLDGDGGFGSLGVIEFGSGTIQVTVIQPDSVRDSREIGSVIYLRATGRSGDAQSTVETAVRLP